MRYSKCVYTLDDNVNMSASQFSDEGMKITRNKEQLQLLYNTENKVLKEINLTTNAKKSITFTVTRNAKVLKDILLKRNQIALKLNEQKIPIGNKLIIKNGKMKILGIWRDFNDLCDFKRIHIDKQIEHFEKINKKLYLTGIIGSDLPIEIQKNFYLQKVRAAVTYGLTMTMYRQIILEKI